MSTDTYQPDRLRHGGGHVDRYTKTGQLVGHYRPDGSPIKHKGVLPPPIPASDRAKFETAVAKL